MTQYDELAARLADIEKTIHFYREHVEFPSFLRVLGPVNGARVLDVGCGDGLYARLVARRGAAHVMGTDSSGEMIRLAETAEEREPLGIQYHVHDVATMPALGSFDLVIAVNVLHYAESEAALEGMCERISANLAPGGRLLAYVGNPECDTDAAREFGFLVDRPAHVRDGDRFSVTIPATPPATVQVYHWSAATLTRTLRTAGFSRIVREEMTHTPVPEERADGLARLLKNPPGVLLTACRE